jgi:hypothetical protein
MPAPEPTPEFKSIVGMVCPYSDEVYSSAEEMVDAGWQTLLSSRWEIAKDYLDELLSGKYSEEELRDVWRASNANVSPFRGAEGSCTEFLEFIRFRYDKFDRGAYR